MTKGAPVRDYTSTLALAESEKESTRVSWDVCFRPIVPGTGWVISLASKHMLNRVLDEVACRLEASRPEGSEERAAT